MLAAFSTTSRFIPSLHTFKSSSIWFEKQLQASVQTFRDFDIFDLSSKANASNSTSTLIHGHDTKKTDSPSLTQSVVVKKHAVLVL